MVTGDWEGNPLNTGISQLFESFCCRIWHGDAAKDFVEATFFCVQFLNMPTLRGFGDAARQGAVGVRRFRKDTSSDASGFFFQNGGAFDGRQLAKPCIESGGVNASDLDCDSTGPFGFLAQFNRRAVGDDLAAIDNDFARTNGINFFENVSGEDDGLFLSHLSDKAANFVLLVWIQAISRFVKDENVGIVNDGLRETSSVAITFGKRLNAL